MTYTTVNLHFLRHYAEMVLAMFAGMGVLGMPADMLLDIESDTAVLANMGLSMTLPMLAYMRWREHAWRLCAEMAAAMLVATAIAITAGEAGGDFDAIMIAEHVVMLVAMFLVMLLRPAEYSGWR